MAERYEPVPAKAVSNLEANGVRSTGQVDGLIEDSRIARAVKPQRSPPHVPEVTAVAT
jgi:hypothetical protein